MNICSFRGMPWIAVCLICCFSSHSVADWPGFLGSGNPVSEDSNLPTKFTVSEDGQPGVNIAWKTPLEGRSVSGPIVVNGRVYTTSSASMEERWMHVSCVDASNGEILWERSTKSTGRPFCHPTSANAAPTPCSDGERVFAFFSSNDLICYDLDGNLQWFRSLTEKHPLAGNDVGMGSSPVVVDGVVVVTVECQADSFTTGLDAETGETLWEIPRPPSANWASPRVATGADGKNVVFLHGQNYLIGIHPQQGEILWEKEINCSTISTAVFANNRLHVPADKMKVFDLPKGLEEPQLAWETNRLTPGSSSLLVPSQGVVGLNRGSILVCCDQEKQPKWNVRLKDAGQFWSTPVIGGDYLYAFALNGKCFTVQLQDDGAEVVAESELGTDVLGSPAIDGDALYVRSVDALWKIAKP